MHPEGAAHVLNFISVTIHIILHLYVYEMPVYAHTD